nr:AAA family ATPase [Pseudodesulfovibrio sp.]
MHRISNLKIENYRSSQLLEVDLQHFTPMVGPNNAGKSNLIRALKWGIKPSSLKEDDFYRDAGGAPVQITLTVKGVTQALLNNLDPKHTAAMAKVVDNETLIVRRRQEQPGAPIKHILTEVWNPTTDKFEKAPTGIPQGFQALFPEPIHVEAMVDAAADAAKNTSTSTIGKLLKLITQDIRDNHADQISQAMQTLNDLFSADGSKRAPELNALDKDTNDALNTIFPGIEARVHVPEPTLDVALKSATVQVQEQGSSKDWQDFQLLGHGAQRSIQMALIQALAKRNNPGGTDQCTLLLIDEPELYLHPQAIEQVREALLKLADVGFQIVFSTHSPQMIQQDDVPHALILRKNGQGTSCRTMAKTVKTVIQNNKQSEILFSLSGNSQILFCDNVLLVEGKTESRLLPYLYRQRHGTSMGADRLGFIRLDGSGSSAGAMRILKAMDIPTKFLGDLDVCFSKNGKTMCGCPSNEVSACESYANKNKPKNKQNGRTKQAIAVVKFAREASHKQIVDTICATAKSQHVWLWRYGDMEEILGIADKELSSHMNFKQGIKQNGIDAHVAEPAELKAFLDWVKP